MQTAHNLEIFRRNPKVGVGLGVILLCIAVGGFVAEYQDYRSLGNVPQLLTFEQAMPSPSAVPDGPRWVRLSSGLKPDCGTGLQETTNGVVSGTRLLASDESGQRWFYVRLPGNANCDAATAPLMGILRKADSALPAWLKNKGITVPASAYPLMEISVNEDPGSIKMLLGAFAGLGLLGIVIVAVFQRMKQASPAGARARAAGA